MAEQDSRPNNEEPDQTPHAAGPNQISMSRRLLPVGLCLLTLLVGCTGWGSRPAPNPEPATLATPAITQSSTNARSAEANAALTRVASTLAQAPQAALPTPTATPVAAESALVPLPTVTPTLVPSPVPTRTIAFSGDATLRLQLNNEQFESKGQPITINFEPRSYVLGGEQMTQADRWCTQVGPTGLVFDLNYSLQPVTENLHVRGQLELYDGFCGEWGRLGNVLTTVPLDVNVPVGTAAIFAPTMQFQGELFGVPNLLDISTGVYLDLTIRNPNPG